MLQKKTKNNSRDFINLSFTPLLSFTLAKISFAVAAPDLEGAKGPGPRAPHHVYVFSHMCDMYVPLSHF